MPSLAEVLFVKILTIATLLGLPLAGLDGTTFYICVALPKGASQGKHKCCHCHGKFFKKLRQCTRSFKNNLIAILTVENKYCHYMKVALQLL